MLVVVTLFGCWLGYNLNSIRQRHNAASMFGRSTMVIMPEPPGTTAALATVASGGDRRARHLLRPALRAQPRDARRARSDRDRIARRRRSPATLAEIQRYTKLFWLNTGPYNNLTARKFVLDLHAGGLCRRGARGRGEAGAAFPLRPGETLDAAAGPAAADVLRSRRRSDGDRKTPPPGKDILTASANNLYAGVTMKDLDGFNEQYPLNSRLVKQNGKLVEEVYRVSGRYGTQIAAHRRAPRGGHSVRDRADGAGAARADQVLPDRRDRRPRGV